MCSVVFTSWWCCGLQAARLLCPWDSPGKILEWVAMPSSRGSSRLRAQTRVSCVSCISGGFFTHWVIHEDRRRTDAQLDIAWPISGRLRIQTQVVCSCSLSSMLSSLSLVALLIRSYRNKTFFDILATSLVESLYKNVTEKRLVEGS